MLKLLSPGDIAADIMGLGNDDHRVILRMFVNMLVWGAIATILMIATIA